MHMMDDCSLLGVDSMRGGLAEGSGIFYGRDSFVAIQEAWLGTRYCFLVACPELTRGPWALTHNYQPPPTTPTPNPPPRSLPPLQLPKGNTYKHPEVPTSVLFQPLWHNLPPPID